MSGARLPITALAALAALAAACVEVPDRRAAGGPPAPGPDGAVFAPDRGPDAGVREPPDAEIDPEDDVGPDTVRDLGVDAAPEGTCPTPCPAETQLAAYVPLDRADALHVLPDGSVLMAGRVAVIDDLVDAMRMRMMEPTYVALDGGGLSDPGGPHTVLMHLSPDLSTVRTVSTLAPGVTGAIVDIHSLPDGGLRLVTSHGVGRVVDRVVSPDRGYALLALRMVPIADDPELTLGATIVPAAGAYQQVPPVAFGADGSAAVVVGSARPAAISELQRLGPDLAPRPVPGWRHHVLPGPSETFGPLPPGALYSKIPLTLGDRCTLRTTADEPGAPQLYVTPLPDGNGGRRLGRRPFDNFASQACPTPPAPELMPPVGEHGWAMTAGLPADVAGVLLAGDGALVVGLDAEAHRAAQETDRVPAVMAYEPDGAPRWWQRLHRDAVDVDDARVSPVAAPTAQEIAALALDASDRDNPAVVVAARGVTADPYPLWLPPEGPLEPFQGQPQATGANSVGWLGRLSLADGSLEAATWIYRVNADPTPERMRSGRLRCFIDEALADAAPQPVALARGRLAVGPQGQVAVAGIGIGLSTTADALQASGAPFEPPAAATFVRIYDRDLTTVLYATALAPLLDDGTPAGEVQITDLAFTADGDLLISGYQLTDEGGGGSLPSVAPPPWADEGWPPETRGERASRGFFARLVPRPRCGG